MDAVLHFSLDVDKTVGRIASCIDSNVEAKNTHTLLIFDLSIEGHGDIDVSVLFPLL